ncbi:hypothetical protein Gogos_003273, partial [Gossypium gossypioides]|nr:hypothetical protein [Gossypium gossypioides]
SKEDYNKALIEGLRTIYDQYLTVKPWLSSFNTSQSLPNHLVVWIQLLGLSGSFYKKCLLEAVGISTGQLIKVDNQMENRIRGQFAKMAVSVDLNCPLISKVRVEGKLQREPTKNQMEENVNVKSLAPVELNKRAEAEEFGSWMVVSRHS